MTTKLLYYGSLERHMDSYMDQVKQTELNEQFQLAQNKIVREGELMNLSQADVMNKLKQLQQDLQNQVAQSIIIPLSKTNAPEMIKQEEKMPISFDSESKVIKKPAYKVENRKGLIDELKEKLQKRKKTQMISEVFPKVNKQELEAKMKDEFQADLRDRELTKFAEKSIIPSSTSTQATTASTTSTTSNINSLLDSKDHISIKSKALREEFAKVGKPWPFAKTGNVSFANMIKAREKLLGQGLRSKATRKSTISIKKKSKKNMC